VCGFPDQPNQQLVERNRVVLFVRIRSVIELEQQRGVVILIVECLELQHLVDKLELLEQRRIVEQLELGVVLVLERIEHLVESVLCRQPRRRVARVAGVSRAIGGGPATARQAGLLAGYAHGAGSEDDSEADLQAAAEPRLVGARIPTRICTKMLSEHFRPLFSVRRQKFLSRC
jgi:hypothetical protein